jgi:hypothetical protein
VYEAAAALLARRARSDLYHSALQVTLPPDVWVVEMIPAWASPGATPHGVVAEGAVGVRWAGRSRYFRYEVHSWRGGSISDLADAVQSPVRVSWDEATCRRLLALLPSVPRPVWGRDENRTGEMWNSNSLTSWALERADLDAEAFGPPTGGRAPGWNAGVVLARRQRDLAAAGAVGAGRAATT